MSFIQYLTSKGTVQQVRGSDTRLNVSSRSDSRSFYVSRDQGQFYVLHIEDNDAAANDIVAFLKNTSSTLSLFIRDIHISSQNAATFKIAFGDTTAGIGNTVTPVNLNKASSNDADVVALGNGAVTGVAAADFISAVRVPANTTFDYDAGDGLILGQNDNIVFEYDTGTTGDIEIDIFFYLDTLE